MQATLYKKQQWSVLNSFIALSGYYSAAWLVDKPWYGRVKMQFVGFFAMFVVSEGTSGLSAHIRYGRRGWAVVDKLSK